MRPKDATARRVHVRVAIAMLAAMVLVPAVAAEPAGAKYFVAKPTGIVCGAFHLPRKSATLRCDLRFRKSRKRRSHASHPRPLRHRRRFRVVILHTRGKAVIRHSRSSLHPYKGNGKRQRVLRLRLNQTRRFGPFRCTSGRRTVSCGSGTGHGFTAGRKFQLVF